MNTTTKFFAAAALSALAVVGAHAESYEGVHPLTNSQTRAAVQSEGALAARSGNVYGDGYGEGVATVAGKGGSRSATHQEAVAAAHGPNIYSDAYGEGVATIRGGTDRASVRAAARAAARGDQLPL